MTKKLLAAILAASLAMSLFAGCSTREEDSSSEPASEQATEGSTKAATPEENNASIPADAVSLIQFEAVKAGDTVATMETSKGTIRIKLFPSEAPKAVENFTQLASEGYYNGVTFHRVIQDFMIQGGDPTGTGKGGESIYATGENDPGYFEDEFSLNLWNFRGALSMANAGSGTNTSQFFIVQRRAVDESVLEQMREVQFPQKVIDKYAEIGGAPHLDWVHTVFGMVIEGMEIVDEIAAVETKAADEADEKSEKTVPVEPVLIENITIETIE